MEYLLDQSIGYQHHILERASVPFLLPYRLDGNQLYYEEIEACAIPQIFAKEPSKQELLDFLQSYMRLRENLYDFFLDEERFVWELSHCYWNAKDKSLCGMYIPDVSYQGDPGKFLQEVSILWITNSLQLHWKDEKLLLFLHRFYEAVQQILKESDTLKDFLDREYPRDPVKIQKADPPEVFTHGLFEVWDELEMEEKERRARGSWKKRLRKLALPFL